MSELETQIANRRVKRDELQDSSIDIYPHRYELDLEPSGSSPTIANNDIQRDGSYSGTTSGTKPDTPLFVPILKQAKSLSL